MTTATAPKLLSTRQITLIQRLCEERDICVTKLVADTFGRDRTLYDLTGGRKGEASELIGLLSAQGLGLNGTTPRDPECGLYRVGEAVVQVRLSRNQQWYAQQAKKTALGYVWNYLGRRVDLRGAELIDAEVAAAFLKEAKLA